MLKIRLRRMGARNQPFYRVVVSDSRNVPTAAALEEIGHYDPTKNPAQVAIDAERAQYWLGRGAQMSPTVKRLLAGAKKSA
jgi:small subunit ribosomal protein S16